jgi:signal transduction histidine kinase
MIRAAYARLSIAGKLRALMTTISVIAVVLTGSALMVAEYLVLRSRLMEALTRQAAILADPLVAALTFRSPEDAGELLGGLRGDESVAQATVFDSSGAVFARYAGLAEAPPLDFRSVTEEVRASDARFMTVWRPIHGKDGRLLGVLALQRTQKALHDRLVLMGGIVGVTVALVSLLAYLLSAWWQRWFTRPLLELTDLAERVSTQRDLSVRAPRRTDDEIGALAETFNMMLADLEASQAEADQLYRRVREHAQELEARVQSRTTELQRAYDELEAFSYSVSHDLRAPLRAISVYTEVVLEDPANRLSPESMQHAGRILAAITRMNTLIDGLLDLARLSKRPLALAAVDLAALAREVGSEVAAQAPERAVDFRIEAMAPCAGDAVLLRQVLANLVSNAFKYSRERQPAEIVVGEKPAADPTMRVFYVRDNGAGFAMRDAGRLFRLFERLHDPRRFEGTGIGLATSRRIIERHGGRIWAESAPGEGATFHFSLPQQVPLAGPGAVDGAPESYRRRGEGELARS